MTIRILVDPPKEVRPKDAMRADVAWKLFLPETMGDIPGRWSERCDQMKRWIWEELSARFGHMRPEPEGVMYVITPELTDGGLEFILRTCSYWSDEVYVVRNPAPELESLDWGANLWVPPVISVSGFKDESKLLSKMAGDHHQAFHALLSPAFGVSKTNIRTYWIPPGKTFARFHSHTAREELYLILDGAGSARISGHSVSIKPGDLISKPTGPDIPTQILADRGEMVKVLDIEIWPDTQRRSKDVVHYPDHGEIDLFGEGWGATIPDRTLKGVGDSMRNYDSGYSLQADGTWKPANIPGLKRRKA